MKKLSLGMLILIVFLIGCATSAVVSTLVVPSVRAGTNPTRWEYKCFDAGNAESIEKQANTLGAEGWEVVMGTGIGTYNIGYICCKRALP